MQQFHSVEFEMIWQSNSVQRHPTSFAIIQQHFMWLGRASFLGLFCTENKQNAGEMIRIIQWNMKQEKKKRSCRNIHMGSVHCRGDTEDWELKMSKIELGRDNQ